MKKLSLVALIAIFSLTLMQAQTNVKFGITGGLLNSNTDIDISVLGFDVANIDAINVTGFNIGAFADIELSEKFHIQPELTYGSAGKLAFVYLPVMMKYYVADKINIQAGPQLSFSTDLQDIKDGLKDIDNILNTNVNLDKAFNSTGVDLVFGAGYDINDKFFVQARYGLEVTNRYSGPLNNSLSVRANTFTVGVGYSFN